MLGQNRQVIFKEDMYDVINDAHIHGTKHLGYKGTFKKVIDAFIFFKATASWMPMQKLLFLCSQYDNSVNEINAAKYTYIHT